MIISASRRTDIPAYYFPWFLNRLKDGFVLVPNPYDANRVSRVALTADIVDCIVFWSKNPLPLLENLAKLEQMGYPFYLQYTLNAYGPIVERNLMPLKDRLQVFQELSMRIGPQRVIWRYDPIFINRHFPLEWHFAQFEALCAQLYPYTRRCIFSFADAYRHIRLEMQPLGDREMTKAAEKLSRIAGKYHLPLYTCSEQLDFSRFGVLPSACIDKTLIETILDCPLEVKKDTGQRPQCGCAQSVDIGVYDTCANGCAYCYAVKNPGLALHRMREHNPCAPMLLGYPTDSRRVTIKAGHTCKRTQCTFFDGKG